VFLPQNHHAMERVGTLINKLKEQFEQDADAAKLLVNTRLLLAELQTALQQQPTTIRSKVSVTMPSSYVNANGMIREAEPQKEVIAVEEPIIQPQPTVTLPETEKTEEAVIPWMMNMPVEIPTMIHQPVQVQKEVFELNEILVAQHEQPELNERLKEEKIEVATVLQSAPVRDLKKAVGINDRYLFVNELFRGDESMYERSMKTINGFTIYPEAQYWIERELKVKLGWGDQCETAKLFDQLVRRRFA
jgi:hypothetical protein